MDISGTSPPLSRKTADKFERYSKINKTIPLQQAACAGIGSLQRCTVIINYNSKKGKLKERQFPRNGSPFEDSLAA